MAVEGPEIIVELTPEEEEAKKAEKVEKAEISKRIRESGVYENVERKERCDDEDIPIEEGAVYYGGVIDTSEAIEDALSILERKGMI